MRPPVLALLVALFIVPSRASAQASTAFSRGPATTIGLSKGAGALTCPFCTGDGEGGISGMIGADTRFRRGIRAAIEADWWMNSSNGASRSVLAVIPALHLYPRPSGALFFKVGLGLGRFSASSDEEELRTTALTALAGVGWEIRLSERSSVVPFASWLSGSGGTMRLNGARVTSFSGLTLLQYGLAWARR